MVLLYLLPFQAAAVICDLYERKIPNTLITAGLLTGGAYQWSSKGPSGLLEFAGGVLIPFLLLGALHCFRMLGAGDIKLLMMTGGFLGTRRSLVCVGASFFIAAVLALPVLFRYRILAQRLRYLADYLRARSRERRWEPYIVREENKAYLHFSIAAAVGSILVGGGFF